MTPPATLQALSTLRENDKSCFDSAQSIAVSGTAEEKSELIKILTTYFSKDLFLYAENSAELKKLFETDPVMRAELARRLKRWECVDKDCATLQGGEGLKLFDLFRGAVIMIEFDKCVDTYKQLPMFAKDLLNKACSYGSYHALNYRIEMSLDCLQAIVQHPKDEYLDEFVNVMKLIKQDADKLSNLYWSLGQIDGANALLNAAILANQLPNMDIVRERFDSENYINTQLKFINHTTRRVMDNAAIPRGNKLKEIAKELNAQKMSALPPLYLPMLEAALQSLAAARMVGEAEISSHIASSIHPDEGLFGGVGKFFGDWGTARATMAKILDETFSLRPMEKYLDFNNKRAAIPLVLHGHKVDLTPQVDPKALQVR
jgi:hypothetical protein